MGQRYPYTEKQKAAICDAMTALLEKAIPDGEFASQLKICGPGILRRAMGVEIAWDDDEQTFRYL